MQKEDKFNKGISKLQKSQTQDKAIILTEDELKYIYQSNDEIKKIPSHHHFEAFLDMWHNEAFAGTPAEGMGNAGKRKYHLYSVDWCGNLILDYGELPKDWQYMRKFNSN